jgi:hypothetical protein
VLGTFFAAFSYLLLLVQHSVGALRGDAPGQIGASH